MILLERVISKSDDTSDILLLTKETVRRVIDLSNGGVVIVFTNSKAYEAYSENQHPVIKADDVVAKLFRNDKDGHPYVILCTKIERLMDTTFSW
jgi:hypothetical protein